MVVAPPDIDIRPVKDFSEIAPLWLDLERRVDASFFQSWAWTGCLAEERFDDPWLLTARRSDGAIKALGLFNRSARRHFTGLTMPRLSLGESGAPRLDTIFIEHNGLLLDRAADGGLARRCWRALGNAAEGGLRRAQWILSGVDATLAEDLPLERRVRIAARRPAPYCDLAALNPDIDLLAALSANTRQQLRRSLRAWEEIGPLRIEIARTADEADIFLDALQNFHQKYWIGRGRPGSFAEPFFGRFHHALIRRPSDRQSVDLVRVSAGDRIVGYLYNLVHDGWVAAYQSGFDFGPDADRLRPGMVCHMLAIDHYRRVGMRLYDFLGGEARYKRSLANAEKDLLWLDVRPKLPWQSGRRPVPPS